MGNSFLDGANGILMSVLDSEIWPFLLGMMAVFYSAMFVGSKRLDFLVQSIGAAAMLTIWYTRDSLLMQMGIERTASSHSSGLGVLMALGGVGVLVVIVALALNYNANDSVPTVAKVGAAAKETGLAAAASWIWANMLAVAVPTQARLIAETLRNHITELQALAVGDDHPIVADVTRMLDKDLRDLLVRYKRVEVARRILPGQATLGDAELVNGLVQIEQAMVEKRKTLATAALNDLKVETRFLELKHGNAEVN